MFEKMESLFQELLDKGLIEVARASSNFTLALANSVSYKLEVWEIDCLLKENWRWN